MTSHFCRSFRGLISPRWLFSDLSQHPICVSLVVDVTSLFQVSWESKKRNIAPQHFRACFRVSSTTFRYLVDVCRPSMIRQDTVMKSAMTVEKREAISLYRLCSSAEERTIGHLFVVGQSVVNELPGVLRYDH
ncbi:hypothetical protein HPB47_018848 [Ixodes persulcatus]|uniref:Uncharacterized protein n=1 Tax=Ixodes persulcatus TaxID=34615 RepID=A0AC60R2I3_IXOPE|nr:hypothetical protein HPB47_018848 [Ixodes persulcatus]